jgi:predicted RNase H-like HicB family nuclease
VIIERSETGFGAYVSDLPGCVAAGATRDEVVRLIQEAIESHIEGLKQDGQPVPEPVSSIEFVDVAA